MNAGLKLERNRKVQKAGGREERERERQGSGTQRRRRWKGRGVRGRTYEARGVFVSLVFESGVFIEN